jgi:hypothetical protein
MIILSIWTCVCCCVCTNSIDFDVVNNTATFSREYIGCCRKRVEFKKLPFHSIRELEIPFHYIDPVLGGYTPKYIFRLIMDNDETHEFNEHLFLFYYFYLFIYFNILIERYPKQTLEEARAFIIRSRGGEVNVNSFPNQKIEYNNYLISSQPPQQTYPPSQQPYPPPQQAYPPSTLSFPAEPEPPIISNTEYVNIENVNNETTSQKKKKKRKKKKNEIEEEDNGPITLDKPPYMITSYEIKN